MPEPKRTPLYAEHIKAGGKMVDFAGFELPIQYSDGILAEHNRTRNQASLFDVSHMGEILVKGEGAFSFLQYLLTNDITPTKSSKAVYSLMCYETGGIVDDLFVYPMKNGEFLLVVNASNIQKDFNWIASKAPGSVKVTNSSSEFAQIALQGPSAEGIIKEIGVPEILSLPFWGFGDFFINGFRVFISRSGYTGEDGFEIYVSPKNVVRLWQNLLTKGAKYGLKPAGLGSRDTLRFESCLPLYGHELSPEITPIEARLSRFVKFEKPNFIGKEALKNFVQKRRLRGFELLTRGVPRAGYEVYAGENKAGYVTSGGFCPTLNKNLALALVDDCDNNDFSIMIRGKKEPLKEVPVPFYKRQR